MTPDLRQIPVMEYIRHLEDRIRKYQREGIRVNWMIFLWGFMAGSLSIGIAWWFWWFRHLKG